MAEQDTSVFRFLGYELKKAKPKKDAEITPSVVPPNDEDGAGFVSTGAGYFGQHLDIDGDRAKDSFAQIFKYRGVAMHPEVDAAIEEICNEAIIYGEDRMPVSLVTTHVEGLSDSIKTKLSDEFDTIVNMLNFSEDGHDIFKRWYIDGRLVHHVLIDAKSPKSGIQEVRFIDSTKIRKVREVKYKMDEGSGVKVVDRVEEYYIFQERVAGQQVGMTIGGGTAATGVKLSNDSINYVSSGLLDEGRKKVISHLQKALKPANQLRMMEDSLVIYRLARAPERRIFYIDTGNLPKNRAEEYMKNIQAKYRNKLVYDPTTGQIGDDKKHMSMLEDYWLPRREGGRGTEIDTLSGGENLGQIDDVIYFQKRLYKSLNVPLSRLEQDTTFSLGRAAEVTKDEIKFQKFIDKIRRKFSKLFIGLLKKQVLLKGLMTEEEWKEHHSNLTVDFLRDNHYTELKDNEIIRERVQTLDMVVQYENQYFTKNWIMKNVMNYTDEEIKELEKAEKAAEAAGEFDDEDEDNGPKFTPSRAPPPQPKPQPKPEPKSEPKPEPKSEPSTDDKKLKKAEKDAEKND